GSWTISRLHCTCGSVVHHTTLLRLHCLCRRAALTTLLLDELRFNDTQHSYALESWLRAGNARGVPVTVGGQLVDSFGAKVLCSRQPVSDTALASALCTSRWSQRARTYSLLTNKRRSASRMLFSN